MIGGLLRLASTVATVFVVLSFALFAIDQTETSSAETVARLDNQRQKDTQAQESTGVRGAIDDVSDALLSPFEGLVSNSGSEWVRHGVPALLGFLLYGLALRLLANAIPQGRRPEPLGWDVPR